MSKAFRILVSALVAAPLGAGGLCCCLLGTPDVAAQDTAAQDTATQAATQTARPCCAELAAPGTSTPACETDAETDECGCPERETATLASSTAAPTAPTSVPTVMVFAIASDLSATHDSEARSADARTPPPPPKQPRYRTLSVFRC